MFEKQFTHGFLPDEDPLIHLPSGCAEWEAFGADLRKLVLIRHLRNLVHDLPDFPLADEPTASLDTERAYQVVETFASLIHEQNRAGIMVTHDLRMCAFVDRVIQMIDGRLARIISDPAEIEAFAGGKVERELATSGGV